jgi:hypothetical protein
MASKRKRKQAVATGSQGQCILCDANNIDTTSDFCGSCAVLKCLQLFQSLESDGPYSSACSSAKVPESQANCLKAFALKEYELDELRRTVTDLRLDDVLRDRQGDSEFQKVLEKLLSCRLSRLTRVALSVRNALDFVNTVMGVLEQEEKDRLGGFDVEVVDKNTSISLPVDTLQTTRVHLFEQEIVKGGGYRLRLHSVQRHKDKGFQDSSQAGYLLRVMAILMYELSLPPEQRPAKSYFDTVRHSAQHKRRTQVAAFVQQLASAPTPAQKKAKVDEREKAAAERRAKAEVKKAKVAEKKALEAAAQKVQLVAATEAVRTATEAPGTATDREVQRATVNVPSAVRSEASGAPDDNATVIGAALERNFCSAFIESAPTAAGSDQFYRDCDASKTQPFTKLLVVKRMENPYRNFYVAPEVFTSLEFCNEQILQLVVNGKRRALPEHLSCIIAKEEAYGPLLFNIAVRCHAFSRLRSLALLVPTTTTNVE